MESNVHHDSMWQVMRLSSAKSWKFWNHVSPGRALALSCTLAIAYIELLPFHVVIEQFHVLQCTGVLQRVALLVPDNMCS